MAAAVGISLGAASPAFATDPVSLNGSAIIDQSNVLGSAKADLQKDVDDFQAKTGNALHVIFVDEFTNPEDAAKWANAVGTKNGFNNSKHVILAVATDARKYIVSADSTSSLSRYNAQATSAVGDKLRSNDWVGAVQAAIKAYGGSTSNSSGSGFSLMTPLIILVIVGVGVFLFVRSRRKKALAGGGQGRVGGAQGRVPTAEEIAQLRTQAGPLLIKADDAIRTSEQEMNFALASYGEAAIKTFSDDLEKAKGQLAESFKLQQQLDDDIPDTPQQQYDWLTQIIAHCNAVNDELNTHSKEFDELRRLEASAPALAQELGQALPSLSGRLEAARNGLAGLAAEYADSAVRQVQDNVQQAQERLSFIESSSAGAQQAAAAGRASEAAVQVRAAQQAKAQAEDLISAVESTRQRLAEAKAQLTESVRAGAQDLAQAKAALANGNQPGLAGPTSALETALSQVRDQLSTGRPDPVALLATVEQARSTLDAPLAQVRDAAEQSARAAQALQSTIRSASAKIEGTEDFVKSRRGGVGAQARTRLAEARRLLDDAIAAAGQDPQRALASAQRAEQLADAAAAEAERDVQGFQYGGTGGYGARGGLGGGFGGMNGVGGAVLGGILGSILASGGSHHSGGNDGGIFGGGDGGFGGFGGGGDFGGGGGFGGFDGGGGDF
jgi:hypothetical protein